MYKPEIEEEQPRGEFVLQVSPSLKENMNMFVNNTFL